MDKFDFVFSFDGASAPGGPWSHLQVIRFRGHEEISALYRYEIILLARAPAPEVDPLDLIGRSASLRIKTLTAPSYHVVHGIIAEAEELNIVPEGMQYRVALVPPLARALYRKRCRIFLEKTTRQIIDAVLQGDPRLTKADGAVAPPDEGDLSSFSAAAEQYAWRVIDSPRIDRPAARPYCVQYNESDFAFVSRLLEEEGISYHYENGADTCLLVLSDKDAGRLRLGAPGGAGVPGREVTALRLGGRLRPKSVSLADYNWKQPAVRLLAEAGDPGPALAELSYPGNYTDAGLNGAPLATARLERYAVEAESASGEGRLRILSAGSILSLVHPKPDHEGDYLITKLDVLGEQPGVSQEAGRGGEFVPFRCGFEAARSRAGESKFRPARVTPAPRVFGSQTAFVTAEPQAPGAVIHVGDQIGCVRLRFHWDTDEERLAKEPSSCWVRVSQMFAGAGEGAVWHPRVGVEVIVEFLEGDPDRPIVTGRVYNGANIPPAPSVGSPTISTWKSFSVPGGAQYNEILFDDAAGAEEIRMHAGKDWNTVVENDRTELIKSNSTSTVGVDRTESTGAERNTLVGASNTETVGASEAITVGASQTISVGANQTILVGANQTTSIDGWQKIDVAGPYQQITVERGDQKVDVKGSQDVTVRGEKQWFHILGTQDFDVTGEIQYSAEEKSALVSKLGQSLSDATKQTFAAPWQEFKTTITDKSGLRWQEFFSDQFRVTADSSIMIHSPEGAASLFGKNNLHLGSSTAIQVTGGDIVISGGSITINGGDVTINAGEGKSVTVNGKDVSAAATGTASVHGASGVSVTGSIVKLNC